MRTNRFLPYRPDPLCVYTRRVKYDKETIRIISARQATRKERAAYAG